MFRWRIRRAAETEQAAPRLGAGCPELWRSSRVQVRLAPAEEPRPLEPEAARRREEADAERRRLAEFRRPGRVFENCDSRRALSRTTGVN